MKLFSGQIYKQCPYFFSRIQVYWLKKGSNDLYLFIYIYIFHICAYKEASEVNGWLLIELIGQLSCFPGGGWKRFWCHGFDGWGNRETYAQAARHWLMQPLRSSRCDICFIYLKNFRFRSYFRLQSLLEKRSTSRALKKHVSPWILGIMG